MKRLIISLVIIAVAVFYMAPLTTAQEKKKVWVMKTEAYPGKIIILWSDGSVSEETTTGGGGKVIAPPAPPTPPTPGKPGTTLPPWLRNLGNVLFKTAGMLFYDSGALVSTLSNLKYIPDKVAGTVRAFLASGIGAETSKDKSAIITLLDGTKKKIDNIYGKYQALKSEYGWSKDGKTHKSDYLYAGYGSLWEGQYKTDYTAKEQRWDKNSAYYNYAGSSYGKSSGVSLSATNGYASEHSYYDREPFKYTYKYDKQADGSYTGNYSGSNNQAYTGNSGYNSTGTNVNGYTYTGAYKNDYTGKYDYNAKTGTYTSTSKGSSDSTHSWDAAKGNDYNGTTAYNYNSNYNYNDKTKSGSSATRYDYKDGRSYSYDSKWTANSSTYTVTDNKTGKVIYSYSYKR